jgi:hypothetical protein
VILRGSFTNLVSTLGCEFQMVRLLGMPKDDAIKAVVVFELSEDGEAQPGGVHLGNDCQMVSRSSDTEYSARLHRLASSHLLTALCRG